MPRKVDTNKQKKESKKNLEANVYDLKGKIIGKMSLPEEIFAAKINPILLSQAIRVYQVNQRAGTHAVKTRTQVTGSTRKIYRQKGTGRARHGDIKAPIFIGGGVAHGPKPYNYSLKLPAKMRQLALFSALTDKYQNDNLNIISGLESIEPKTKNIVSLLKNLALTKKDGNLAKKTLLVLPDIVKNIIYAGRNVENLNMTQAKLLNTYNLLANQNILFMKESVGVLKNHLIKKEKADEGAKSRPKRSLKKK
ncbi:50S ribosomal protein L4 [Candidatus Gottesmanbacteria bacterium]|nr:50S ribosomal protein L4 [Candidatus Gottesmanbacteria bacterium]MBI5452260.1 50S ribosomal protein L4 [Candidatus Gottesmanbacteria bacterium]